MPRSDDAASSLLSIRVDAMAVFALALVARLAHLFHGGVLVGLSAYDQSVYYAAAGALVHGRAPYAGDFVFLHPPGIILAGAPFALLGRLTTAPLGFMVENLAFATLAAATAGLIVLVARRAGTTRWAALAAGTVYGTWSVSVAAGASVRLEPLGDVLLVLAVLLLGPGRNASRRHLVLAGVVFGLLLNVKLWWVVPIALLFVLMAPLRKGLREVAVVPLVALVTCVVIDLPFLLISRGHMFTSVIASQLGRTDVQGTPSGEFARLSTMVRLERLTGAEGVMGRLYGIDPADADPRVGVVTVVVCALAVIASGFALRTRLGRIFVPVLAAQIVILLAAPIYFPYYGDFVAVPLSLVVAAAASAGRSDPPALAWLAGLWPAATVLTLVLMLTTPRDVIITQAPDTAALGRATRDIPCIVADTPRLLIALDALDRSFADGCRNWVDFQGVGHGGGPDPNASVQVPTANPAWRRTMMHYFRSGDAVALSSPSVRVFLGRARVRKLTRGPLVATSRGVSIHRTPSQVR